MSAPSITRVVYADADAAVRYAFAEALSGYCAVHIAASAVDALNLLRDVPAEAVVTAEHLSDRNGPWLLSWVARRFPAADRVLVSNRPDPDGDWAVAHARIPVGSHPGAIWQLLQRLRSAAKVVGEIAASRASPGATQPITPHGKPRVIIH